MSPIQPELTEIKFFIARQKLPIATITITIAGISLLMASFLAPTDLFLKIMFGLGGVLSGFIAILSASQLFDSKPQVIINNRGIQNSGYGFGLISWDDITAITVVNSRNSESLAIQVSNLENYKEKAIRKKGVQWTSVSLIGEWITIPFSPLTPHIDDAIKYIHSLHPEKLKGVNEYLAE